MRLPALRTALRSGTAPLLALALLTGCGGSSSDDPSPDAAPSSAAADTLQPLALVRASADETSSAGSARIDLTSETVVGDQTVAFTGTGAFDPAAGLGQFDLDVPMAGGVIQQRIVDGTIYLSLPQEQGVFYSLDAAAVAGTSLGSSSDPTAAFQALNAVSDDVREVGTETIRDTETTHFTGTYDATAAIEQAQGLSKTVLESTLGGADLSAVPFDVYLDDEGRIRRFEQVLELPASEQTGGQPLVSKTSVDVYDFGTKVDVVAPAPDQVKDGAPLLAALQGAAGGGQAG